METLIDLISIVNRRRISKMDVLDKTLFNRNSDNLYYKFYNGIEKGKINNDDEGAKLLYGTSKEDPRFRMLKSRLKEKMLKSVLLFDLNENFKMEANKAYYKCVTHWQIIEVLVYLEGINNLVHELILENYALAQKYRFYDILKRYSSILYSYYGLKGEKKEFLLERQKYLDYSDLAEKESLARYLYHEIIVDIANNSSITDNFVNDMKQNVEKLRMLSDQVEKPEIKFFYLLSTLVYFDYTKNVNGLLQICNEANEMMDNDSQMETNTRRVITLQYKLKAALYSKKYDWGISLMSDSKKKNYFTFIYSSFNWFRIKEIEFKLQLRKHNVVAAREVYYEVIKSKNFKRHFEQLTEKWKIFHAYLVFMDNYLNQGDFKFSIPKFMNEVPIYSKDKTGYNFAIRIVEILFLFGQKRYNFIFQKMDALRIYRTRYLNDRTHKRNHLFLSLILRAEKVGFKGSEMQKADWPELEELRKDSNYIIADWEIIPYEDLWDIIVDLAKK